MCSSLASKSAGLMRADCGKAGRLQTAKTDEGGGEAVLRETPHGTAGLSMGLSSRTGLNKNRERYMQATLKKAVLASGLAASVAIMALTGCQSTSDRSAGRQLDDRIVNSKVKDALEDHPMYKFPEVRVMTY